MILNEDQLEWLISLSSRLIKTQDYRPTKTDEVIAKAIKDKLEVSEAGTTIKLKRRELRLLQSTLTGMPDRLDKVIRGYRARITDGDTAKTYNPYIIRAQESRERAIELIKLVDKDL